jgi:cytochrome c2
MGKHYFAILSIGAILAGGLGLVTLGHGPAEASNDHAASTGQEIATRPNRALPLGEALFERRCGRCHELDEHDNGPALGGIYGSLSGHQEGFAYSRALQTSWIRWDDSHLDQWLQGPDRMVIGTKMRARVRSRSERAVIIAYLKQVGSQPHQKDTRL